MLGKLALRCNKSIVRAFALAVGCSASASPAFSQEVIRLETSSGTITVSGPSPLFDTIAIGDGTFAAAPMGGPNVEAQLLESGRTADVFALRRLSATLSGESETLACDRLPDTVEKPVPLCSNVSVVLITMFRFDDIRALQGLALRTNFQPEELVSVLSSDDTSPILNEFCNASGGFGALEEVSRTGYSVTCRGSNQSDDYLPLSTATRIIVVDDAAIVISVHDMLEVAETHLDAINQVPADRQMTNLTFYPAYERVLLERASIANGALRVATNITVEFQSP